MAGETSGWPATPPRRRSTRGAFAVLIIVLVVTVAGGVVAAVSSRHESHAKRAIALPPRSNERAVRSIVADNVIGIIKDPMNASVTGLSWRQLKTCLDLDRYGTPRHPVTMPTDDPDRQSQAIAAWLQRDRRLTFRTIPKPIFVSAEGMSARLDQTDGNVVKPNAEAKAARATTNEFLRLIGEPTPSAPEGYDPRAEPLGIYLGEGRIYVQGEYSGPLSPTTMVIASHEMEHALVDEHFHITKFRAELTDTYLA